ncbi:ParB/RepB/Spo0J family partition protein [Natronincola ferrireducens]|uniref:Chromosome segregation DNA-binding protein n=1 Tax=Natronincola ferrireducens TaxID=393762 RepID=A0A1G9HQL3_9FIRM|nr:ParB/RepB/Spo0J family partition protein [Natronincola ferrireducens]SDL15258.1 chromosome segregation DNA-binding protein [Natronincola ferrireducens]
MAKPNKKKGLGKGLQALIPQINALEFEIVEEAVKEDRIKNISINKIYPNPQQPRKDFNKATIEELAASIKTHGLIQPIVVIEKEEGFMIIAGERRWRAGKEAELKELPCIIRKDNEQQLMEIALIENLQREDLNIIEEAKAYKYLIDTYSITQDQLGEAIGKSRPYIANILRLLQLDSRIIDMIREGQITAGHARALLSIHNLQEQYQLALKIEREQLNVRQVEEMVRNLLNPKKKPKEQKRTKDAIIIDIEENLKRRFGTKVNIMKGRKKGKIEIEYYNDGDLERILSLLEETN